MFSMFQTVDFKGHILQFSGFVWHESDVSCFAPNFNFPLYLGDGNSLIFKEFYLSAGKAESQGKGEA